MEIEAEFDERSVQKYLNSIMDAVESVADHRAEYIELLSAVVFSDVTKHFEEQRGPDGKWAPWSDIYRDHLKSQGITGNKILQLTGAMRDNFSPTDWKEESGAIIWFNNARTSGGFPYAALHNAGGSKMPKREFMWLSSKAEDSLAEVTMKFIMEKIDGNAS